MGFLSVSLVLAVFFSIFFQLLSYMSLADKKMFNFTFDKLGVLVVSFLLIVIANIFEIGIFKPISAFLLLFLCNKYIFDDPFNIAFNTSLVGYILVVMIEIILSILTVHFKIIDYNTFNENELLVFFFSFTTNVLAFLQCKYNSFFKNVLNKINKYSLNRDNSPNIIFIFLVIVILVEFKYIKQFNIFTYIVNIILVFLISIIFRAYLKDEIKVINEIEKADILLDNIAKYEKIIDNNRINSHEMLNNLLMLRSIKNKNSKKYEKLLDDMITMYDKTGETIRNISILPKNIKGIIYYKLYDLDKMGIKMNINISKQISNYIEKINHNDYVTLCRIIPTLLDNAIYSCKASKDKNILVDFYREKDNIIISIENSCNENVDLKLINKKYYSTKGENRGLGLYVVNKLLVKSLNIHLEQFIENNTFISKIIVQNKKD